MTRFCKKERIDFAKKDLELKLKYEASLSTQIKRPLLSLYRLICVNDYKQYPDIKNNPKFEEIKSSIQSMLLKHYEAVGKGFTKFQTKQMGVEVKDSLLFGAELDPLSRAFLTAQAERQTGIIISNTLDAEGTIRNTVVAGLLARYIRDYIDSIDIRSMPYDDLLVLLSFLKKLTNRANLIGLVETRNSAEITKLITALRVRQAATQEIAGEIPTADAVAQIRTAEHSGQALDAMITAYTGNVAIGAKAKKEWNAILDNRTRESHRLADGQVVDIDENFIVDGEELMYPGDDSRASLKNTINCRCTAMYYYD